MRGAVDITARVEADGVSIRLPRLCVQVEQRQAERLRDVLNSVLPEQITDLMHDPRIKDEDVLQAAAAMQAEGKQPKVARTLRLLHLWGDVDPEISGPYDSDEDRLAAAQDYRRAHGDENGVYKLDVTGDVEADVLVESYTGGDLEMPKPERTPVHVGDDVRDPLDGEWRTVKAVTGLSVIFTDDCTMGIRAAQEAEKRPRSTVPPPKPPSKWVSSAWIEGRNALVVPSKDGQRFEMHAYETRDGSTLFAGKATFVHDGDAHHAGSIWTRTGEWDSGEAIRGCTLCRCTATGEVYGLPVCDYHTDHSEDEPRCPDCVPVHTGDRVRDPLDGTWRTVTRLDLAENTAHMADGGCMSIDEAGACEKRLPSEELPS